MSPVGAAASVQADDRVVRTADLLGGRRVLGRQVPDRLVAHALLREGLPGEAVAHLINSLTVLPSNSVLTSALGLSARTLQRRKGDSARRLDPNQSGRAWKFAEILARAIEVFGSQPEAEAWLERPATGLGGERPVALLETPAGTEMVADHLTRLEYGVYL